MITYFLASAVAFVLFALIGWKSRQNRMRSTRPRPAATFLDVPGATVSEQAEGDVEATLKRALKRLMPLIVSRGVTMDVAVRPALIVRMSGGVLTDLLEELLAVAIDHAPASRMVVTAVSHGAQVAISVTGNTSSFAIDGSSNSARQFAERLALRGATLEIQVQPVGGTTMTVRLAAAVDVAGTSDLLVDADTPDHPASLRPAAAMSDGLTGYVRAAATEPQPQPVVSFDKSR